MKYRIVKKFSVALFFVGAAVAAPKMGTMTDSRDGKTYKTVKIGEQTWMAENLNFETPYSYCYGRDGSYCTKYGRHYTWEAAKMACPSGWRLPRKAEFEILFETVGGKDIAGRMLKSQKGWMNNGNSSDPFGFRALPAGFCYRNLDFDHDGYHAYFWSSTEHSRGSAYYMDLYYDYDVGDLNSDIKSKGFSVRCLQDETIQSSVPSLTELTSYGILVDDRDGQSYKTVDIGTQTWMAENLNYADSVSLQVESRCKDGLRPQWCYNEASSWCYDNKPANCTKYGRLYTWDAANMACPSGWHLPSQAELDTLFMEVDGSNSALRSQSGWYKSYNGNGNGDNASGFSALPSGYRNRYGDYGNYGYEASFWSSTEDDVLHERAILMQLRDYDGDGILVGTYGHEKKDGLSVRCLKDTE